MRLIQAAKQGIPEPFPPLATRSGPPASRTPSQVVGTNPNQHPNLPEKTNPKSDIRQLASLTRHQAISRSLRPCALGSAGCQPAAGPLAGLFLKSQQTTAGSTSGCKLTARTTGLGPRYPVPGARLGSSPPVSSALAQIAETNPPPGAAVARPFLAVSGATGIRAGVHRKEQSHFQKRTLPKPTLTATFPRPSGAGLGAEKKATGEGQNPISAVAATFRRHNGKRAAGGDPHGSLAGPVPSRVHERQSNIWYAWSRGLL